MRSALLVGTTAFVLLVASSARAEVAWVGDFETGDLKQWSARLNEKNISVATMPVLQGTKAGRIELTNDSTWPNGLKRVELNHSPKAGRTAEGKELYFAWSFYLPETLPVTPSAQIGYWESDKTYQQMMAFQVEGERITFSTRRPTNKVVWDKAGAVTPGVWHRLAMHVLWSEDATKGKVDVWFDGTQVVTAATAKTLADANPVFTQVGLLRGQGQFDDTPVIVIDDAVEGDTLADVRPALPVADAGADASASPAPAPPGPGDTTSGGTGEPTGPKAADTTTSSTDDGGCRTAPSAAAPAWAAVALAALGILRLRKKAAKRGRLEP